MSVYKKICWDGIEGKVRDSGVSRGECVMYKKGNTRAKRDHF